MEKRFLHITQTGEIPPPGGCDDSCQYVVEPRATINKATQTQNYHKTSQRSPQKCSSNPQKGKGKKKSEEQTPKGQMENNHVMANVSPNTAIITLRKNDLNMSIKKHRLAEWIKTLTVTGCHSETHFKRDDTDRLKSERMGKDTCIPSINSQKR